nr:unnamed protein product [Callosobruchus chinensis]
MIGTLLCLYLSVGLIPKANTELARSVSGFSPLKINKCCEPNEIYVGRHCTVVNASSEEWRPLFVSEKGDTNLQINYTIVSGAPDCGHMQLWPIYHYHNSTDRLRLLPNGVLRHYFDHVDVPGDEDLLELGNTHEEKTLYHDYEFGKYCLDKNVDEMRSEFAWVCAPDVHNNWHTSTEFIMRNIVSPATHFVCIVCFLTVAIVYFVMPTLRDLTGNIVTTICVCLIISQAADIVRLLTVFKSHVSILITETICYISLLGAFFWLNTLGYYIWKTFKSRNVFLRITDGKKYCYYGGYAWSCTLILGILAVFAHFTMDYPDVQSSASLKYDQQEEIGSLGMVIFFVPVAFTVLVDVFFFATTLKTINKMHTYGRIHHKLRHSFRMFLLLLFLMTICWLFLLASFSKYDGLINSHIIANSFLGPLVLYICVFNQKHVAYLIRKTCCYKNCICPCCRPETESEWGDEMTAMNTVNNY